MKNKQAKIKKNTLTSIFSLKKSFETTNIR